MNKTTEIETHFFDCLVTINVTTTHHPSRIEECHGMHEFSEDEEDLEIEKVEICLGVDRNKNEVNLDITSLLTEQMKNQILKTL